MNSNKKTVFIYGEREKLFNYVDALEKLDAEVIVSKNIKSGVSCDALLLPGGADIDPKYYGENNTASEDIDLVRDEAELTLVKIFTEANKPILGICRGHQVLTVAFGGTLIQDISDKDKITHSRMGKPYDKVHPITAERNSFLYNVYGERFTVNSAHHQASGTLPANFEISAKSDDGIIEGICDRTRKIFGVQFHPERMCFANKREDTVDGKFIIKYFLEQI